MDAEPTTPTDPQALVEALRHWGRHAPDRRFLDWIDLEGATKSYSYGEFYAAVRRLAGGLTRAGLRPGDPCAIHTGNSPGFLLAFWAIQEAGGIAVPTITQYADDELRYVLEHCEAWGVITTGELADVARRASPDGCRVIVESDEPGPGEQSLAELLDGPPLDGLREPDPSATALVLYTSGTTSRPKGVMLSHGATRFTAACYCQHLRLRPDDVVLTCMPLFHVNGLFLQMAAAVFGGCRLVLTPRFSTSRYWSWVERFDVTVTHLISGPIRLLLGDDTAPARDHRVRVMTHGLPLTDEEIDEVERRYGIPLTMVWGLTETCCGGTMMPIGVGARPGLQNIGPAMIGWEVEVVDERREPVDDGILGELVVRSRGVMTGYHRDPDATAETLVDGWVRSGDLGYRDAQGFFHFVDRAKDMLKPSGENVAASEVEAVILEHPAVTECAVLGVPDRIHTERVIALIVLRDGGDVSAAELRAHCTNRLARFKVPSAFVFRGPLPRTSIGKIRKGDLRQELLAEHEAETAGSGEPTSGSVPGR